MNKSNPLPLNQQVIMTGWNTTKTGRKMIYRDANGEKHQTKPIKSEDGFLTFKYNNGIYYIKEDKEGRAIKNIVFRLCKDKLIANDGTTYNLSELHTVGFRKYAPILDVDITYLNQLLEKYPPYQVEQILGMSISF